MNELFGIDFGTTNSAVVGRFHRNVGHYGDDARQPFPSLVAVNEATGRVQAVGREAWNRRQELSASCRIIASAKTYLGSQTTWRIGPELWTPERAVTEVLKALRRRVADAGHGVTMDRAVIAIPVGFSPDKRKALRNCAKEAGIAVAGFVSEPTAAIFKNFHRVRQWPVVVVFDWGGGTLDISVVAIKGTTVEEIATVPNPLAGDKLDLLIAEWAHSQILRDKAKADPPFSGMEARYRDLLISQCENAKRTLATDDIAEITLTRYGQFGTVNLVLTAQEFDSLMAPPIETALATLEDGVLHRARLSFDQIGCIIMVGGSSKLRGLREAMDAKGWSCDILFPEDSDWHVADGAAILASNFGTYVCAQNVGIRLCDNTIYPLLRSGDEVKTDPHVTTFGLIEDADNARFVFVEGHDGVEGRLTTLDRILGYLSVPAYGFSNEPIRLQSQIDEDLLLHVKAQSECRAKRHEVTWTYPELRFRFKLPDKSEN